MAVCPNCGKKLRFIDWKQDCPSCGVNLIYFGSNERLLEESEKAEIEHAKHQPGIDRAKASIFGSPQAIARLVLSVIPLGVLFLPLCKSGGKSINAIGIYKYISSNDFSKIISNALGGKAPDLSLVLVLVSAVLILVSSICLVMSLGKHGKIRNLIFDSIKLLCAVTAGAAIIAAGGYSLSAGAFVYIALFAALLVYNLVLAKKGLPVKHTVCYIGGLPSEEYYRYVEEGMSELEIRKKMVEALTAMQEEVRRKEEEARAKEEEQRSKMK
jgi:hypothetical protein